MSKASCIMVQGTMSGAGKSLLCAALCRIFAQDGYRTAPFKSQNMALNSFVTRDGLEMGRAQVVQAQAAGIEPDVRMNPILLKPSSDVGSQVIVNGEVRGQMPAAAYFKMKRSLIPDILAAYNSLAEAVDIIVIEGAGSPAEINLKADDIVNMGLAKLVDAPVLLAGDIDRGGVFAQLYGTVELLEPDERARIKGLIINKFRGDVEILRPGLAMLEEKTHLPVLGVVPYLKVDIEDEDSLSERLETGKTVKPLDIAILRLPHISNFTDFMPLEQHPLLGVRYVQNAHTLGTPDLVILPGTKNTVDDLLWLRQSGLEPALLKLAAALERSSEHPLAEAIMAECETRGIVARMVEDFAAVPGRGVTAREGQNAIAAGNVRLMNELGVTVPAGLAEQFAAEGKTPLFFAKNGELAGTVAVADEVKETSAGAIAALRSLGVDVRMLTGDNRVTAEAIARRVGLSSEQVIADVLPADKERHVRELQDAGGKVAMVGDGINDSPALARADVGLAIGTGADIAKEGADVVLMRSDLMDVVRAIELSRATIRNIKQDLFWALFYNGIGIPLAAGVFFPLTGWQLSPMFGAAAMSLSSVCVVSNALRLKSFKPKVAK